VYDQLHLRDEVEAHYLSALKVYSQHYANSMQYANCLQNLGNFYRFQSRKKEACELLEKSQALYSQLDWTEEVRACSIALNYLR